METVGLVGLCSESLDDLLFDVVKGGVTIISCLSYVTAASSGEVEWELTVCMLYGTCKSSLPSIGTVLPFAMSPSPIEGSQLGALGPGAHGAAAN